MLVVIPTYKRNECLRWVLQSVAQSCVEAIPEQIRVLVINNYPPAAAEISQIVSEFAHYEQFEWSILFRERTLPPVENWYSAIFASARPDEVVFINSDDDLLLPLSLQTRYFEITRSKAHLLLAKLGPSIFFSDSGKKILCSEELTVQPEPGAVPLDFKTVQDFAPQHLSNHCYRNTRELKLAYEKAIAWGEEVSWLDENNRTIFLPLYLTFALMLTGSNVYGVPVQAFLRGRDIDELRQSFLGIPSWNHGFIHAVALVVMGNSELKGDPDLDGFRHSYRSEYIRWFFTYAFDRRLRWRDVITTQRRAKIEWSGLLSLKVFSGLRLLGMELMGLRGLRVSRLAKNRSIAAEVFLQEIADEYAKLSCTSVQA